MPKDKKNQESGSSAPWITTFCNLTLLLLAFFVVLVVMSEPSEEKIMAGISSLFGAFGIPPDGMTPLGSDHESDFSVDEAPVTKARITQSMLQEIVVANGLLSDAEIRREDARLTLSLSDRVLFEFGTSRLQEQAPGFLKDLSQILKSETGRIELRGYADHSETVFSPDPLMSAYELSIRRALVIHHHLLREDGFAQERMAAHGFGIRPGRRPPIYQEATWGTQVEIILDYATRLPYSMRTQEPRTPYLEFKGFLFRRLGG